MDLGRLFRFGTNTVENLLLRWPRYSFQPRTAPCISFRSIGHADQPTGPKSFARGPVFSLPSHCFVLRFPSKSSATEYKGPSSPVRNDCLTDWVENVWLTMSFHPLSTAFSAFSFQHSPIPRSSLSASYSSRRRIAHSFFPLSILFLFYDYTVVPSSWRFLAAGKKTWSTSFVRGFLSPSSVRPIKGKVLAPGTRATLASPGTPGFGCYPTFAIRTATRNPANLLQDFAPIKFALKKFIPPCSFLLSRMRNVPWDFGSRSRGHRQF